MKKVIIIGAGAHAAEIEEYIIENNKIKPEFEIMGYLDDNQKGMMVNDFLFGGQSCSILCQFRSTLLL